MELAIWKVTGKDNKERTETASQALAFRLWQESGCSGSAKVFEEIGKHRDIKTTDRTIWRWKEQFRWAERNAALETRVELEWANPTEETVEDAIAVATSGLSKLEDASGVIKNMHLAIIDKAILRFDELLDDGRIKITSVKDLKTLMETRQLVENGGKGPGGKSAAPQVIIQVITSIPRPRDDAEVVDAEVVEVETTEQEDVNE